MSRIRFITQRTNKNNIRESLGKNGNQSRTFIIGENYGRIVTHCDL